MRATALVCLLGLLLGAAACGRRHHLRATKRVLRVLPLPWRRPSINVAEDASTLTFTIRDKAGYYVVTPDGRGETYDDVGSPLFARDSHRVFYWGSRTVGGRSRYDVVLGETTSPTPFTEPVEIVTSRGGARWAAVGAVDPGSPDAPHAMAIVVDGHEMGRATELSRPDFSPDGAHVVWIARAADGTATLFVDGTARRTFQATVPPDGTPRFDRLAVSGYLTDGRIFALVPDGDDWTLWRDEEKLATYGHNIVPGSTLVIGTAETKASVVAGSFASAKNAPVVVWWERMAGAAERWRVVRDGAAVDGMECATYWGTQPPVVTDDGAHVAYVCPTPNEPGFPLGHRWVVLDGRRFGTYVESWTLGVSNDGTQVAYGAADALPIMTWRIFANGTPRTPPEELVWRPRFSPDGTHVLWAGGPERGRRRLGVDHWLVTRFDDVLSGPEFPTPDTGVWVIRRGRKISRIEVHF